MFSFRKSKSSTIILITLFFFAAFCNLATVQAAQLTWTVQTVDAAADVGEYTSLAIDSNGNLHASYYDGFWDDLKYAKLTGSTWTIMPVDTVGHVGYLGTSIAVDSNDNPHISYYDQTNGDLKYARWTGSTWIIQTVESTGTVGLYSSIALDSNNRPHISYYDYINADLKYAHWTGSTWNIQTVDSGGQAGTTSSIQLDSNNRPHIAYKQFESLIERLKYARWTGTAWSFETIQVGPISSLGLSLKIDSTNSPHISYFDGAHLMYTKKTGSTWNTETVDASQLVGAYSSLALDSNDSPHIAYDDGHWQDLKYAKLTGYGWLIKNVDNVGVVGTYPSLVLDSTDHPHIVYRDDANKNLKYTRDPDETVSFLSWQAFDSDGDLKEDSVKYTFDIDTTYSGTLSVFVLAGLIDDYANVWAYNSTILPVTSNQPDSFKIIVNLPEDVAEGYYGIFLSVEDDGGTIEDYVSGSNDVYLYPPQNSQIGYLTGTVTDLDTGLPLQGIEICMGEDLTTGNYQTLTNSTGQYYLPLSEGEYEITAHEGEGSLYFDESANVTIIQDVTTTQDFQLQRNNWMLDISVIGSGTTDPQNTVTRQVGSWAQVEAFPDEGWILDYWILDFVNVGSENPFSVLMDSDHNLTAVFVEEPQVGFLAGQVKDFDTDLPIPEAEVAVNGTVKLTDPAGNYEFELEPGEYNITVSRLGYISETRFVTIAADAISTQDFLLQKTEFTLVIEVEGMGSTTPSAGTHQIPFGTEIVVEAFPNSGWNLGNWVFDSIWHGPEDAFPLIMNNDHELLVVFVEDTAIEPFIESCNEDGGQKDVFSQGDNMYVTGGFFPSGTFEIYVVNDVETWTDGMAIPSRVLGTETTVSSNLEGHIPPTNVWSNLQTLGEYDIVIDVNDNGLYDLGVDALDDNDLEITAGVEVISEIISSSLLILVIAITLGVIIYRKQKD